MSDKKTSDKTSDKLLNCPFCGGEAEEQATVAKGVFMHEVVCKDCGFESKVQTAETPGKAREKAIAAWNQRKPISNIIWQLQRRIHSLHNVNWNAAMEKAIEIVKEEGGLND